MLGVGQSELVEDGDEFTVKNFSDVIRTGRRDILENSDGELRGGFGNQALLEEAEERVSEDLDDFAGLRLKVVEDVEETVQNYIGETLALLELQAAHIEVVVDLQHERK